MLHSWVLLFLPYWKDPQNLALLSRAIRGVIRAEDMATHGLMSFLVINPMNSFPALFWSQRQDLVKAAVSYDLDSVLPNAFFRETRPLVYEIQQFSFLPNSKLSCVQKEILDTVSSSLDQMLMQPGSFAFNLHANTSQAKTVRLILYLV